MKATCRIENIKNVLGLFIVDIVSYSVWPICAGNMDKHRAVKTTSWMSCELCQMCICEYSEINYYFEAQWRYREEPLSWYTMDCVFNQLGLAHCNTLTTLSCKNTNKGWIINLRPSMHIKLVSCQNLSKLSIKIMTSKTILN